MLCTLVCLVEDVIWADNADNFLFSPPFLDSSFWVTFLSFLENEKKRVRTVFARLTRIDLAFCFAREGNFFRFGRLKIKRTCAGGYTRYSHTCTYRAFNLSNPL